MVVTLKTPIGINPNGVKLSAIVTAPSIPVIANFLVLLLCADSEDEINLFSSCIISSIPTSEMECR